MRTFKLPVMSILAAILICGCKPSIHEVVEVLSTVPLGTSRTEMLNAISKAYPKQIQHYQIITPPILLTSAIFEADTNAAFVIKREGGFVSLYPTNLFEKMPNTVYRESLGIIRETNLGGGSLEIYYDEKTNYIGFAGQSIK